MTNLSRPPVEFTILLTVYSFAATTGAEAFRARSQCDMSEPGCRASESNRPHRSLVGSEHFLNPPWQMTGESRNQLLLSAAVAVSSRGATSLLLRWRRGLERGVSCLVTGMSGRSCHRAVDTGY